VLPTAETSLPYGETGKEMGGKKRRGGTNRIGLPLLLLKMSARKGEEDGQFGCPTKSDLGNTSRGNQLRKRKEDIITQPTQNLRRKGYADKPQKKN